PFFFPAEDGIRACHVTGVQTCALPISKLTVGLDRALRNDDELRSAFRRSFLPLLQWLGEPLAEAALRVPEEEGERLPLVPGEVRSEERRVGHERISRWPSAHDSEGEFA